MPVAHDEDTRKQALSLYKRYGLNETARRMEGVAGRSVIHKWAKEAGLKSPSAAQRRSPQLNRSPTYQKQRRIKLNDRLFAKIERILTKKGKTLTPNDLRALTISYAVLVDKRRLEEDESNSPGENITPQEIYEEGDLRMKRMEREYEKEYRNRNRHGNRKNKRIALAKDVKEERASRNGHSSNGHLAPAAGDPFVEALTT